jgi:roadblock/LC7 domain-containing protein
MADLDKLMSVKGVWAAGEFSPDGKLIAYKGNISEEHAAMAAMMCAANTLMAEMETQDYTAF